MHGGDLTGGLLSHVAPHYGNRPHMASIFPHFLPKSVIFERVFDRRRGAKPLDRARSTTAGAAPSGQLGGEALEQLVGAEGRRRRHGLGLGPEAATVSVGQRQVIDDQRQRWVEQHQALKPSRGTGATL